MLFSLLTVALCKAARLRAERMFALQYRLGTNKSLVVPLPVPCPLRL